MCVEDMADLIRIYDATMELTAILRKLCSSSSEDLPFFYDDGIIGKITKILCVIERNYAIDDRNRDYNEQVLFEILDGRGKTLSYEERASMLLGQMKVNFSAS